MAKQSGIHQLRGKVGDHSYYRQSGISSGLMRSINQAMSKRVKTGDEFANTRLNNDEFRNAAQLASAMGGIILPKFRPMILPFSQSKLTSAYLQLIKETTGNWGQRNLVIGQQQQVADKLNDLAKKKFAEMFADISPVTIPTGSTSGELNVGYSADQSNLLSSLNITGVTFKVTPVRLLVGEYDPSIGRNRVTFAQMGESQSESLNVVAGTAEDFSFTISPGSANVPGFVGMLFAIVIAMPYRNVNGIEHVLQEYCSFKCVPVTYAV